MGRVRNRQAGFTLIELMFVVAILAVLAAIALPQFMSDGRKTKANAEVTAFFAELGMRQEQYKVDNGVYLATALCPATTNPDGVAVDCTGTGKPWELLNVQLPTATAYCTYETTIGNGAGPGDITVGSTTFTMTSLNVGPWYYIVAQCDLTDDGTTSAFFTSSTDSRIQKSTKEDE